VAKFTLNGKVLEVSSLKSKMSSVTFF
jgi:hypothetical protein